MLQYGRAVNCPLVCAGWAKWNHLAEHWSFRYFQSEVLWILLCQHWPWWCCRNGGKKRSERKRSSQLLRWHLVKMSTVHTETISVANKAMPSEMEKGKMWKQWSSEMDGDACSGARYQFTHDPRDQFTCSTVLVFTQGFWNANSF